MVQKMRKQYVMEGCSVPDPKPRGMGTGVQRGWGSVSLGAFLNTHKWRGQNPLLPLTRNWGKWEKIGEGGEGFLSPRPQRPKKFSKHH